MLGGGGSEFIRKFKEAHDLLLLEDQRVTLTSLTGTKWQCCSGPSACRESAKRGFQRHSCERKYVHFLRCSKWKACLGSYLLYLSC